MILKSEKLQPLFAAFCAFGWSLAYPLIKLGYSEIGIGANDTGSKIMFAGIRFFVAGLLVILVSVLQKKDMKVCRSEGMTLIRHCITCFPILDYHIFQVPDQQFLTLWEVFC